MFFLKYLVMSLRINSNINFDSGITYLLDDKKQLDLSLGKGINNDMFFISGGISINID